MQSDMHYYGVYALARAAGLSANDAGVVAYASQFVDDATHNDTKVHADGGKMYAIATAHHSSQTVINRVADRMEQRRVWVPCHFLPGAEGENLLEKLICRKDSQVARDMLANHIVHAAGGGSDYALHLMGIACHVYADTFSHYGFSGVGAINNAVKGNSFEYIGVQNEEILVYLQTKFIAFMNKYTPNFMIDNWRKLFSSVGQKMSGALGHGAVGTYPDRPYLHWKFTYETGERSDRNNPKTYMEACEKLHSWLSEFADTQDSGAAVRRIKFGDIREKVERIIRLEAKKEDRIAAWKDAIKSSSLFPIEPGEDPHYDHQEWEADKENFKDLANSADIIHTPIYKYHQAAIYHRYYVLKRLLPKHRIAVF